MIMDKQVQILNRMKENGFELVDSSPTTLEFKRESSDEEVKITILCDSLMAKTILSNSAHNKSTVNSCLIKDFEQLRDLAEKGFDKTINDLRKSIEEQIDGGGDGAGI